MKEAKKQQDEIVFETLDGKPFEIPIDGSLGLLALGDIGLLMWRKKRNEHLAMLHKNNSGALTDKK